MRTRVLLAALAFVSLNAAAQTPALKTGIDKANMDLTVKPGDDFYEYADGGWLKSHPLDAQHPMNGAFVDLEEQNNDRIRDLVKEYAEKKMPQGTVGQKIGSLYRLYMDSVARNKMSYQPIKPMLDRVEACKTRQQLFQLMYELDPMGYGTLPVGFGLDVDPTNADKYMFSAGQGGLSLDPEYYTHPNEQQKAVVEANKAMKKDLFKMVGFSDAVAEKKMQAVWAFQSKIAPVFYDQNKQRDPMANIHKMSWAQFMKTFPEVDWTTYCKICGYPNDIDTINVGQPEPISATLKALKTTDLFTLKAVLENSIIGSSASILSDAFNDRVFKYRQTVYGVKEQQPRWKRGVNFIQGLLGESIGKLYAAKYFPASAKERATKMIKDLQDAFAERIEANTWMTPATKAKAIEKLRAMIINVGYPDKWEDLEKYVEIDENKSIRANYDIISKALIKASIEKHWKKPVDKTIMDMYPQTVNACYDPQKNSINFPAAILQPPFFDADAEDAANYGAIGTVIGHEMSHGFDDQGCQFDKDGNLANWWTAEDKANYDKRTKVLADWFSQQEAVPGLKVDGNKTLGENIGDNGGLHVAYLAFQNAMKQHPLETRDGFTPNQRFFLAYGRIWASNIAPQFIAYIVNSDVHSPNRQRVNAALPMIDEWYDAFNIKAGDKLFVPAEKRAHIW